MIQMESYNIDVFSGSHHQAWRISMLLLLYTFEPRPESKIAHYIIG